MNKLNDLSILPGRPSLKITEKHYSPWIRERQEQAEADVRRSWSQDPSSADAATVPETKLRYTRSQSQLTS